MACTVGAAGRFGRGAVLRTAAAYAGGVVLGAVCTFALVGVVSTALHPGRIWLIGAAAIAAAAAVVDALGLRVRPQVRLQVPERWRRTLPLPLAVFLYGLLLGPGIGTYVPAMAAWALIVLSLGLGSLTVPVIVGTFLAVGKILAVVLPALRDNDAAALLAERPGLLRGARAAAAGLLACGVAATLAGPARAVVVARPAEDPSVAGVDLAWQQPGVGGFLSRGGGTAEPLPGADPAIGGSHIAWHVGSEIVVADRTTLEPIVEETVAGVQKLAVSDGWLAYRQGLTNGSSRVIVRPIADLSQARTAASARWPAQVGRPSLSGDLLVYHVAAGAGGWIASLDLSTGKRRRLRSAAGRQLLNPSTLDGQLLYVDVSRCAQQLRLGRLSPGHDRVLLTLPPLAGQDLGRERGHTDQGSRVPCRGRPHPTRTMLWTTALTSRYAYVTTLRPQLSGSVTATLLRVGAAFSAAATRRGRG
jgi:hypothetical protein